MNISTMIADAAIQYPESKNGPFAGAPIGQVIKEEIPEALRNKLSLTDYVIKGSIGNGNFASIPWIAIMDKEITTSTRKGFYIVFLFSSDGQRIYLTLNQGITYFDEKKYKRPKVKEISNKIYETFPSSTPLKMDIDLNSNTPLGKGYESTTISAFEYDTSNMPSEEKLLSDLSSLLDDYSELKQFFVDNDNDLEKFYSAIIGNGTSDKYKEFKYLLSRFVEQANSNLQNKNNRKTSLGIKGFEDNNFRYSAGYDQLTIDGVEYHIHLFSTGSYGPNNGEGSTMVPYICHRLANGNWSNIRVTFQNSHMTSLRLVEWNQNSKTNKERNISFFVDDLDLFSNAEPNDNLKKLYKEFVFPKVEEKNMRGNDKINELADKLERSKNIILRGAPGTGKTYLARQIAALLIGEDEDKLNESEQFGFVQFHPSYDYTDFVEGLRPVADDDQEQVSFKLRDGIFKRFCKEAKKSGISGEVDNFDDAWEQLINAINESEEDYMMTGSTVPATLNSKKSIKFKTPVATGVVYPSTSETEYKKVGTLSGYGADIFKQSIHIPQQVDSYREFDLLIKKSEYKFKKEIESFSHGEIEKH
ncbi:MrcB family domain-containing protein [Aerococcus urinaeequi]|uniref:MrcB family domain-containing protein n=1 Tax=Aerococcus urinaeequi TaxID=51665 RepID=UPI003D6A1627